MRFGRFVCVSVTRSGSLKTVVDGSVDEIFWVNSSWTGKTLLTSGIDPESRSGLWISVFSSHLVGAICAVTESPYSSFQNLH